MIDLTDNEVKRLENFPRLHRLSSLFVSNNAVSKVDSASFSPTQLPSLHTLLLTNNRLLELSDLEPLAVFAGQLQHLSLLDNPVTKKPHYRLFVLSRLPKLRTLDFKRVRPSEVAEGVRMFPAKDAHVFEPGEDVAADGVESERPRKQAKLGLSPDQVDKIKKAIASATTLAEVNRLEKILQAGHVPDATDLAFLK